MSDSTDPRQWFRRAELGLRTAANNLADDPEVLAEEICYSSHQACEKALKGFLLYKGESLLRTHDLIKLLDECCRFVPSLIEHKEQLLLLNDYCIDARYPGDYSIKLSASDAREAYLEAKTLLNVLFSNVNS